MKLNKRFPDEFGSMLSAVTYKIEPETWIPWLLDRAMIGVFMFSMLTIGAFAQYCLPLALVIFAGIAGVAIILQVCAYLIVIIAMSGDDHGDGGYPGS